MIEGIEAFSNLTARFIRNVSYSHSADDPKKIHNISLHLNDDTTLVLAARHWYLQAKRENHKDIVEQVKAAQSRSKEDES